MAKTIPCNGLPFKLSSPIRLEDSILANGIYLAYNSTICYISVLNVLKMDIRKITRNNKKN